MLLLERLDDLPDELDEPLADVPQLVGNREVDRSELHVAAQQPASDRPPLDLRRAVGHADRARPAQARLEAHLVRGPIAPWTLIARSMTRKSISVQNAFTIDVSLRARCPRSTFHAQCQTMFLAA